MSQRLVKDADGNLVWVESELADQYEPPCGKKAEPRTANHAYSASHPWITGGSSACQPSQVAEFNAELKRRGIRSAVYHPDGRFEATRRGRAETEKARRLRNFDAGFGDWGGK